MIIEKYFNLTAPGVGYDIKKHLALGWYIDYHGLTTIIMKKHIKTGGLNNDINYI